MPTQRLGVFSSFQFGLSLIRALRAPLSSEQAATALKQGVENRIQNFLRLCDTEAFCKPEGVYGTLFSHAGISRETLGSLTRSLGLEPALLELARKGVFLDADEFKGRKPLVRNTIRIRVDASSLDRAGRASIPFLSSGSSGNPLLTPIDVPGFRLLASCIPLVLRFMEAERLPVVLYYPMPSGSGFMHLITFSMIGKPPVAWFTQWMPSPWWAHPSGVKLAGLIAASRLAGISLPAPRLAAIKQPAPMAAWLRKNCPHGAVIPSFTGSAIQLVQAAKRDHERLPPLTFLLGGEPLTERKRSILEREGHRVFPWYSSVETGRLAMGCLAPRHADDMHLLDDRIACVIRPRPVDASGDYRPALLFTSLHPDTYKFLVNVETGDEAAIHSDPCHCPWEIMGFHRRVSGVRSFEKLTLEGTSLVADILAELIEEGLPSRCGGTPADYQFTEEEHADGITRLVLSVNPAIPMDSNRIRAVVSELFDKKFEIAGTLVIRAASIYVRKEMPKLTRSGKMLSVRTAAKGKPD